MIHLTAHSTIIIATSPADFRAGIDGFVARCQQALGHNPRSGELFAFINRARTMVRILVYEKNGYWLMTKRLSKGRYRGWPDSQEAVCTVQAHQLRQLLLNMIDSAHE